MRGFQLYGFVILRDHPVPSSLLDEAHDLSAALFAQAEEIKCRYVGSTRGYAPDWPHGVAQLSNNSSAYIRAGALP
jgi:isopenicillin N synthase-like dioxygenase